MGGLVLTSLLAVARADCPPTAPALDEAERLVLEFELDAARAPLDAARATFECRWADPADLARYWLVEGVAAWLADDPTAGSEAFAAAARTGAARWNPDYGPRMAEAWAEATARPAPAEALEVTPTGARVRVDGADWTGDPLAVGLHVIQLGGRGGALAETRFVRVTEGTALRIEAPDPGAAPRRPELRVLAMGAAYGRFEAAAFGGVAVVGALPVAGKIRAVAGGHGALGRDDLAGPRLLLVLRAGAEAGVAGDSLRVGAAAAFLPQDLGATAGALATVGGGLPLGPISLDWELSGGWAGGGLLLVGVGVAP